MQRRHFIKTTAATIAASAVASAQENKKPAPLFGFDNFSIRALGWKAGKLLDYAAKQKVTAMLFSNLDVYESHDDAYLKDLSQKAQDFGIKIYAGTGGICPTAHRFSDKWGDAPTMLSLTLKIANKLGSPVARCYQGFSERQTLTRWHTGTKRRHAQSPRRSETTRNRPRVKIAIEKPRR